MSFDVNFLEKQCTFSRFFWVDDELLIANIIICAKGLSMGEIK